MKVSEDLASHAGGEGAGRPDCKVLVVDADPTLGKMIHQHFSHPAPGAQRIASLRVATGIDVAELELRRNSADVVFVNLQIDDNAGLSFIRALRRKWPRMQIIAVSRLRRSDLCIDAWRAGATDMLLTPVHADDLRRLFSSAGVGRSEVVRLSHRNERLRIVCRRLNKARHEISQQVDLLCNDLVRAYQEMAQQLNLSQMAADFAQVLRGEIEVEGVLRRTMEWILRKLGPVNAAVYLPNGERHFALGAYLNLDTHADAPLIDAVATTVVEQARSTRSIALEDDRTLQELFGDEAEPLLGKKWVAAGCQNGRECLAVLVIFRNRGQKETAVDTSLLEAIAPVLAERIDNALGMYHRLHPFQDEDGGQEMDAE